jgi:hypothetical protein
LCSAPRPSQLVETSDDLDVSRHIISVVICGKLRNAINSLFVQAIAVQAVDHQFPDPVFFHQM